MRRSVGVDKTEVPGISENDRRYCESLGIEGIRIALLTNANLAIPDRGAAWRWLKEQDERATAAKARYAKWNLAITIIGAIAAIIAALASLWVIFR
jgi:hypothetical protein